MDVRSECKWQIKDHPKGLEGMRYYCSLRWSQRRRMFWGRLAVRFCRRRVRIVWRPLGGGDIYTVNTQGVLVWTPIPGCGPRKGLRMAFWKESLELWLQMNGSEVNVGVQTKDQWLGGGHGCQKREALSKDQWIWGECASRRTANPQRVSRHVREQGLRDVRGGGWQDRLEPQVPCPGLTAICSLAWYCRVC